MPPGANRLIDLPEGTFLDTEEEINVIAGSLWLMSVKYDKLEEEDRARNREELRKVRCFPVSVVRSLIVRG